MSELERQLKDAELLTSFPGGFGRASCKREGEMEFIDIDPEPSIPSEEYKHGVIGYGYEISGLSEEDVKFFQEKLEKAERDMLMYKIEAAESRQQPANPTAWVEREVPEHLEDAAHDLITILLKSHGYNWEGEKQDDNRPTVK